MNDRISDDQAKDASSMKRLILIVFGAVSAGLAVVTAVAAIMAYGLGEGVIYIEEKTISELTFMELTGGTAAGIFGAVFALGMAAFGGIGTLVAAIVGAGFGVFGAIIGLVVAIGVVTGPLLLVAMIAILIKRRFWPDVI